MNKPPTKWNSCNSNPSPIEEQCSKFRLFEMSNCTNLTDCGECVFDPYWIYALSVPFLGVLFNGALLFMCVSILRRRKRRRSNRKCAYPVSEYSRTGEDQGAPFLNSRLENNPDNRPQFALNSFVANCAWASLLGSCLRTITTSYLFTLTYVLCPVDASGYPVTNQAMQILLYLQHSVFNVAYVSFLIVLNLDKLLFIMKPLHYRTVMTRRRVILVSAFTWILSSAWLPFYFAQNEEEAVRWGTILVTVLMIVPSVFCLVTSAILAVVVLRVQMQDRLRSNNPDDHSTISHNWIYCRSLLRLFQSLVWTCVTSLPHPLAIIISYYTAAGDMSEHIALKLFIGYLSIAYFTGTPFVIMWTYPVYWRRFKLCCA